MEGLMPFPNYGLLLSLTSSSNQDMRRNIYKHSSTKAERVFAELLKRNRIPYQYKIKVEGREVDFIIGKLAIEINGHPERLEKNKILLESGYIPVNIPNAEVLATRNELIHKILCLKKMLHA